MLPFFMMIVLRGPLLQSATYLGFIVAFGAFVQRRKLKTRPRVPPVPPNPRLRLAWSMSGRTMFMRNTLRSCGIHVAVVAAFVSIVSGLIYCELRSIDRPESHARRHEVAPSVMFEYKPTLLIVGDSYADTYPDLVADKMGWSLALDAQDGTGFVHCIDVAPRRVEYIDPPPRRVPFIDRLDRDAATYNADYVLIDGGRTDMGNRQSRWWRH